MKTSLRNGYTMHQLLWVMTLSTMIFGISVTWIHQTTKFSRRITQHKHNHDAMTRLAWNLRDDVRSCNSISLDKQTLTLTWKSGDVQTYLIKGSSVLSEKKVSESETKLEEYALSELLVVSWDETDLPNTIGLVVERTLDIKPKKGSKRSESLAAAEPMPIDLVVRVSPDRWSPSDVEANE